MTTHLRTHSDPTPVSETAVASSSRNRRGYLWLLLGTALSLFAVHGQWDVAAAAWLFSVFFLRFTRGRRIVAGLVGVWAATAVSGVFWLYESGLPPLSPFLLLSLAINAVLLLPYLVDRLVAPHLGPINPLAASLAFPLARVGVEYLMAVLSPVGTIFGSLAATQHSNLPLLQMATVTGSYGISFLVAWFATVALWLWEQRLSWSRVRTTAVTFGAVLGAVVLAGGIRLAFFAPDTPTVRVAGISPARSALEQRTAVMDGYPTLESLATTESPALRQALAAVNDDLLAASEREARAGAKIIVWSETGAGVLAADKADLLARAATLARTTGIYLQVGLGVLTREPPYVLNQAIMFDPDGRMVWTYNKAHPVPLMEVSTPGDGRVPTVDTGYGRLATVICFDADFPMLMRQGGRAGADVMLVPSSDWPGFGKIHSQKSVLRAVENGYAVVRPDQMGYAQVVDHHGRVLATADYFATDRQITVANVPTKGVRTIYATIGDVFAWLSLAGLGFLIGMRIRMARRVSKV